MLARLNLRKTFGLLPAALAVASLLLATSAVADAQSPSPSPTPTGTAMPPSPSPTGTSAPAAITINVGNGEPGYDVDLYLPASITIKTGTTVTWMPSDSWPEPHTVTVGQPQGDPTTPINVPPSGPLLFDGTQVFSSGTISGTQEGTPPIAHSFSMTFIRAGNYNYSCAYHPFMKGTVSVLDTGSVDTQAAADTRGQSEYQAGLAGLKAAAAAVPAGPTLTTKPNGTRTFGITVGAVTQSGAVPQYFPPTLDVTVGDSVTWTNSGPVPHTVTFHPEQFHGDPFAPPAPVSQPYDGSGLANSGIIGVNQSPPAPKSFTLVFGKAGAFQYVCLLHDEEGMKGVVNVAAGPRAPLPPQTGSGPGDASDGRWPALVASGALLLLASVLFFANRRRSAG